MNTNSALFRTSLFASLLAGTFATASLAGPGPQYWAKFGKPAEPPAKTEPAAKCTDCKTTKTWTASDRGPAGKGAPGARVTGTKHECARCTGAVTTEHGKTSNTMAHNAACVPLACCK